MTLPTGVLRRGGVFWLRVLIPDDLRHLYPRTSKGALATDRHRASLRTTDKGEARAKALALRAEFEHEFNEKRRGLQAPAVRPTAPLRAILADAVYAARLALDDGKRRDKTKLMGIAAGAHAGPLETRPDIPDVSRFSPLPDSAMTAVAAYNAGSLRAVRKALASGDLAVMLPIADKAAKALGLAVAWDSDEGAETLEACLRAYARALEVVTQRDAGMVIETPEAPKAPEGPQEASSAPQHAQGALPQYRTIRDLLPLWKAKAKPTVNASAATDLALRCLDESGIPTDLATLKGSHGAAFRDWLRDTEARGFGQKTGSNRFGAIATLLNTGTEYDAIPVNPWAGLRFPVEGSKRREPFRREELQAIHQSAQFSTYSTPSSTGKGADVVPYWGPLLGLFSGARIGEIAQLEVADVRLHDGVHVLDIHEDAEGSTVKTANGLRRVPVHPELVRLGFLDYVADLRAAGESKLLPSLHRPGAKSPGYLFGQAFRAYLDSVGVTRPLATFHAYRHGFRSALENSGASSVRIHRIVGHADGSVDARYTHLDMAVMAADVAKVAFPFLDLPRVYPTPT